MTLAFPEVLRCDNFTSPQRTPWGGTKLPEFYKRGLEIGEEARSYAVVGESWEISVDPAYPSVVRRTNDSLWARITQDPIAWLGTDLIRVSGPHLPFLVKWIDTADVLSVQVHPTDDFPGLTAGETGKWEAWCILQAEPGAGVYLGFHAGVTRAEVKRCAEGGGRLDRLLNFVPVHHGDVFVIEPGTPHALGAGVTLLEPQVVAPNRSGVTYRFWDWNRLYDEAGRPAAAGRPRRLHLAESLEITRWDSVCGDAFAQSCSRAPRRVSSVDSKLTRDILIETTDLVVERWQGSGQVAWDGAGTLIALTCVGGEATLATDRGAVSLRRGESAVVPAAAAPLTMTARDLELLLQRPRPSDA